MNSFFARRFVVQSIFIVVTLLLLSRLFYIQVIDDSYVLSGKNNVLRRVIKFPARGSIMDRTGKPLAQNEPVYDIMVIPREVKAFDTLEFCRLLNIDKEGFDKRMKKARTYSPNLASPFEKLISARDFAAIQEKLSDYPGFFKQSRTVRAYPDSVAAHFLGYTLEANQAIIEKFGGYYRPGDFIGIAGVEKSYEELLRGQRGVENVLVDARGRPKGIFAEGKYDTAAVAGDRLKSSLDLRIQKLGEQLMANKVGSIVAIEPATGEILAFVSSPSYDPNLMVGHDRGKHVAALNKDPYKPLLVRPVGAWYSPGSSFKPLDALIALQEGLITPSTTFFCPGYYMAGNHRVACEHTDGTTDMTKAIKMSCNTYFCNTFEKLINKNGPKSTRNSFIDWRKRVAAFGLGDKLNVDLPFERKGNVPTDEHYDKVFGKNRWRASSVMSLAIGQGELLATPLQLANIECVIANRGYYYTPHLIKSIGEKEIVKPEFRVRHNAGIDARHFEPVINGMQQVVESGTAAAVRIPNIIMCGKTGTVQNNRGKNHSVFVAFAPRDNPKIAIAVVVENAGYGSSYAAPIASYLVELYLTGNISRPKSEVDWMKQANLMPALKGVPAKNAKPANSDSLVRDSIRKGLKTVTAKTR
ncbi:penicillin-binding protein 2 [Hufsiella ginkgonis]|uniref:Penicillin-binding protein 2 n=1 Tax=Hufsiella ginkgonis TaxID=2695274 RepID=A0A7K1XUX4_9SPHI|nr:penicillin-binding protein 2 [Hufsiella ginkgonis]MXV14598.1 penicillin-binding protein 2 [Hufsiella ginkgonis]